MSKEKAKELMIDIYGAIIFLSALVMLVMSLVLSVMSVGYVVDREILSSMATITLAGILIFYSIVLMRQIAIDGGGVKPLNNRAT